jgi:Uma2 family endonuclease
MTKNVPIVSLADLDMDKVYTYADYFMWKFEERVELIKGKIFKMSPAPNAGHQFVTTHIVGELFGFLRGKPCRVISAPFDVRFPRKSKKDEDIFTVLQPDACVVCDHSKLDSRGCIGAPDIVVEVLSKGNNAKELKNKYVIYEESGVREYWVVYPDNEIFIVHTLVEGKFVPSRALTHGDVVTSSVLPGFSLDLKELFEEARG